MPFDESTNIIQKMMEIDAKIEEIDTHKAKLQESRRILVQRWMTIKNKPATELATMVKEIAEEVRKIRNDVTRIQEESSAPSSHFSVLERIANALLHARRFPTIRALSRYAKVAYNSFYNNRKQIRKIINENGLDVHTKKTKHGVEIWVE